MSSNLFGRYVWLIDLLRQHKRLTYKEINAKWQKSGLSYGEGDELPLRTFHNHRNAIRDIFDVSIEIDKSVPGYQYHIEGSEQLQDDALRSWLIDSYATLNQLQADKKLKGRIQFENIPSGSKWLTLFMQAMREDRAVEITHQGFGRDEAKTFVIEPYHLKVSQRRWYIIANNPYFVDYNERYGRELPEVRVYGLDRIQNAHILDTTFKMKPDFDITKFYEGCPGIIPSKAPTEHVVLRSYTPDYLRSLPLHASQKELESDDEATTFSYEVKVTYDFVRLIMQEGDQVEVIEPASLREQMKRLAETLMSYYNKN